jgi:hypothetical protein
MRYCPTCVLASAEATCPACSGPTSTWPFALTAADRTFLRSALIAVDDDADAPPPT